MDIREIVFRQRDDLPVCPGYVVVQGKKNTVFTLPRRAKLVKREADKRFRAVFGIMRSLLGKEMDRAITVTMLYPNSRRREARRKL